MLCYCKRFRREHRKPRRNELEQAKVQKNTGIQKKLGTGDAPSCLGVLWLYPFQTDIEELRKQNADMPKEKLEELILEVLRNEERSGEEERFYYRPILMLDAVSASNIAV